MTIAYTTISDEFIRVLQRLRYWCPLKYPMLIFRTLTLDHNCNGTFKIRHHTNKSSPSKIVVYFYITILMRNEPHEECETLVHEWAHALTYDKACPFDTTPFNMPLEVHGIEWGIAYARCYSAARKSIFNTKRKMICPV